MPAGLYKERLKMSSPILFDYDDPRARGYNYGIGWGREPKPPAYLTGMLLARVLNKKATEAAKIAWDYEMLVRNVRLATTAPEKTKAVLLLEQANERVFAKNVA